MRSSFGREVLLRVISTFGLLDPTPAPGLRNGQRICCSIVVSLTPEVLIGLGLVLHGQLKCHELLLDYSHLFDIQEVIGSPLHEVPLPSRQPSVPPQQFNVHYFPGLPPGRLWPWALVGIELDICNLDEHDFHQPDHQVWDDSSHMHSPRRD